ncbi:hypothetical protein JW756_03600 [Candidatus Woesearchaeota archaeon]|nr:hypothetical protein [Candidatus Woesearchaeota archaeon]
MVKLEKFKKGASFLEFMTEYLDEKTLKIFDELADLRKDLLNGIETEDVDPATAFYEATFIILNKAKSYGNKFFDKYMQWHKENQPEFYQYALDMIRDEGLQNHEYFDLFPSFEYTNKAVGRIMTAQFEKDLSQMSSKEFEKLIIGSDEEEEDEY